MVSVCLTVLGSRPLPEAALGGHTERTWHHWHVTWQSRPSLRRNPWPRSSAEVRQTLTCQHPNPKTCWADAGSGVLVPLSPT
eukprot:349148-Amphidinium_carterae.1